MPSDDDQALRSALLALVPEDGSGIGNGNGKLREQLAAQGHDLSEEDYAQLRGALVADGVLAKGRGRGGSVKRSDGAATITRGEPLATSPRKQSGEGAIRQTPEQTGRAEETPDFGKQWHQWGIAMGGTPASHEDMLAIGDDTADERDSISPEHSAEQREP